MSQRINYFEHSGHLYKKLIDLGTASNDCSLERSLIAMVHIVASQLNGCAFCLDMHSKEAKIHGERELRLYHLSVWRESPLFSAKEKAVFEWTEAVTKLPPHGISDVIYKSVREHLSEKEMSELTFAIGVINFFNRLQISSPMKPGFLDGQFGLDKAGLK